MVVPLASKFDGTVERSWATRLVHGGRGGGNFLGTLGGYPTGLFEAAAKAVSGLSLSAGDFLSRLAPEDYQDIIDTPRTARFCAEKWSYQ